jgi:hypothetical protein
LLPSDAEIDAAARVRIGAPPKHTE